MRLNDPHVSLSGPGSLSDNDRRNVVEVRRAARHSVAIASAAALVAIAFALRGGAFSYTVAVLLAGVALLQAWLVYDARTPLLIVDEHGVRIRFGRAWSGLPWSQIDEIEHLPRQSFLQDGRLAVIPSDAAPIPPQSRAVKLAERLYGLPYAVPLGAGTKVVGGDDGLTDAIAALAPESVGVVEVDPSLVDADNDAEVEIEDEADVEPDAELDFEPDPITDTVQRAPISPSPTPSPLREADTVVRSDVTIGANALKLEPDEAIDEDADAITEIVELTEAAEDTDDPDDPENSENSEDVNDAPEPDLAVTDIVDHVDDPVIGPDLAAARTRIGLTIDTLAERTRIRPHVIEAIEADDFGPCGGDFYARGHLRTLARVLGLDSGPLLASYDERYATGPVDPRAVFQAELATASSGTLRKMRGGPNWSILVAAVMAVVLVWAVARIAMESGPQPPDASISLGTGDRQPYSDVGKPVPVTLTAAGGGARVVLRDGSGEVVFNGDIAFGASKTVKASPPVRVQTSDGSLKVALAGSGAETVGATGKAAQRTFAQS